MDKSIQLKSARFLKNLVLIKEINMLLTLLLPWEKSAKKLLLMILLISSAIIQVKSKLEMDSKRYSIFMILIKAESSNSSKSNMLPDKSDKTWLMMLFWIWCTQFLSITKQPQTSQFHSKNSIQWYLLIIIRRKIKENSKSFDLNELFNLMNILT